MVSPAAISVTAINECEKDETPQVAVTNKYESEKSRPLTIHNNCPKSNTQFVTPVDDQRLHFSNLNVNGHILSREVKGKEVIIETGHGPTKMDWGPSSGFKKGIIISEPNFFNSTGENDVVRC